MLSLITSYVNSQLPDKDPVANQLKTKPWRDILLDSIVIAGIAAFAVWQGTPGTLDCFAAIKAFGAAFFIQVAYYRGIKKV